MVEIEYQDGDFYAWKDKETGLYLIAKDGFVCGRIIGSASDLEKVKESIEWHKGTEKEK